MWASCAPMLPSTTCSLIIELRENRKSSGVTVQWKYSSWFYVLDGTTLSMCNKNISHIMCIFYNEYMHSYSRSQCVTTIKKSYVKTIHICVKNVIVFHMLPLVCVLRTSQNMLHTRPYTIKKREYPSKQSLAIG